MKRTIPFLVGALFMGGCASKAKSFSEPEKVDTLDAGFDAPEETGFGTSEGGGFRENCEGLRCHVDPCGTEEGTTITGTVYDPAARNPIYNVIVYVPNKDLEPFQEGVTCDQCGAQVSGSPISTTLTDAKGHFVLKNVPSGYDIPLVMQIGKWRRQIKVPFVQPCTDTSILDPEQTRLPRNRLEGDIPRIAITTGGCDPFECLLINMGIDTDEFTDPSGDGRIHLYQGNGGRVIRNPGTPAKNLWGDLETMKKYDVRIDACECSEDKENKTQAMLDATFEYSNLGGRLFTTHYQYYWIDPRVVNQGATTQWGGTAKFVPEIDSVDTAIPVNIDMSFPKGQAFAEWLYNVGASASVGKMDIKDVRFNVEAVNPPSTRWIYTSAAGRPQIPIHYTFNTPVDKPENEQCGKVLFSDFHVAANSSSGGGDFPLSCRGNTMSSQQMALEFMLFDLSSCIQKETEPPRPPK